MLAVLGDLTLTAGARYFGPVLVGGRLTVSGGSEIHGLVRAGADVSVGTGVVTASACPVLLSLGAAVFDVTLPLPEGWVDPM